MSGAVWINCLGYDFEATIQMGFKEGLKMAMEGLGELFASSKK